MDFNSIQKSIDKLEYWDARAYDFSTAYFGDEAYIWFEGKNKNDIKYVYKIDFIHCRSIEYKTDAYIREEAIKKLKLTQLDYFVQDISIKNWEHDFIFASLNLSFMKINIICREIAVKEIPYESISFFWINNG